MVRSALKALALVAALAAVQVVADAPTGDGPAPPSNGDGPPPPPPNGDGPPPPPPNGDGPPPPPKGDGPPPPPKGDGPPPPPKGDGPPPPPKGDGPPPPPKGDGPPPPPKGDGPPPPPKGDGPPPPPEGDVSHWGDWPAGCKPISFEPYVCDDDYGKEYTTTYTLFPHDCTLYYEKPTPKPTHWNTWVQPTPDPKPTWTTWEPEEPKPTWEPYHPHPYPPKPTDPAKWAEWEIEKKIVIITLIEEYNVPCETGWAKETTTIYTTHCGCEETPVPVHPPYKTYTTDCPESWGLGKTVTVVVPAPTWTPAPDAYTWLEWNKPADDAKTTTWANYPVEDGKTTTWANYPVEDAKTTTWANYPVEDDKTATWSTWYSSTAVKPDVAKPTGWSPVASWQGAASTSAVSKVMVVAAGAVAGLALFL